MSRFKQSACALCEPTIMIPLHWQTRKVHCLTRTETYLNTANKFSSFFQQFPTNFLYELKQTELFLKNICTYADNESQSFHTLQGGQIPDYWNIWKVQESLKKNKFTWRVISYLQNIGTSRTQPWYGAKQLSCFQGWDKLLAGTVLKMIEKYKQSWPVDW